MIRRADGRNGADEHRGRSGELMGLHRFFSEHSGYFNDEAVSIRDRSDSCIVDYVRFGLEEEDVKYMLDCVSVSRERIPA